MADRKGAGQPGLTQVGGTVRPHRCPTYLSQISETSEGLRWFDGVLSQVSVVVAVKVTQIGGTHRPIDSGSGPPDSRSSGSDRTTGSGRRRHPRAASDN